MHAGASETFRFDIATFCLTKHQKAIADADSPVFAREVESKTCWLARLHTHRAAGGDRHHCHSDRSPASSRSTGAGSSAADAVPQSSQAIGIGFAQLSRHIQHISDWPNHRDVQRNYALSPASVQLSRTDPSWRSRAQILWLLECNFQWR